MSEFYLKELSEQTSRLMQTNLNEWKKELQVVVKGIRAEKSFSTKAFVFIPAIPPISSFPSTLRPADGMETNTIRALQEYISKMKENNQFDFLAMVDESGMTHNTF